MKYPEARLMLGMAAVGTWVAVSAAGLYFDWSHRYFASLDPHLVLAAFVGGYVAVSAVFDLLGGYVLPKNYGYSTTTFLEWLKAALAQAAIMYLSSLLLLEAPGIWALAAFALVSFLIWVLRVPLSGFRQTYGDLREVSAFLEHWAGLNPTAPLVVVNRDPSFPGGFARGRRMLLPNQWLEQLPPATIAAEMVRRCGLLNGGHVWRGVLLAWLWNLAGFATVALLPVTDLDTAPGLVNQALAFTLWSFLGLLVLPSLSRPAEHAADLYAIKAGVPKDSLVKALGDIDAICNRNPSLPSLVESIFHPVPSLHKRPLTSPPLPQGAWKASRIALLMSWAGLGLLGRAVHTNVGLPEQWVW